MPWTNLADLTHWLQHLEPMLPVAAGAVSAIILFGCAITSWLAPEEEKDCLFHREVI